MMRLHPLAEPWWHLVKQLHVNVPGPPHADERVVRYEPGSDRNIGRRRYVVVVDDDDRGRRRRAYARQSREGQALHLFAHEPGLWMAIEKRSNVRHLLQRRG